MNVSFTSSSTLRPDAETLDSVRRMCARLVQQPDLFAAAFRDNYGMSVLGGSAPHPAIHEDALRLAETVVGSIARRSDPDDVEFFWASTAGEVAASLPSDDLIPAVVKALVRSVRDVLGDQWSTMKGSQWAAMQLWLVPYLTAGYGRARAAGFGIPTVVEPPAPEEPLPGQWPPSQTLTTKDGPDPATRHDRKHRGAVRNAPDGEEWVP